MTEDELFEGTKMLPAQSQPPLPPTTTVEEDKTLAGQRNVNIIWEATQALIAILMTLSITVVTVYSSFSPYEPVSVPDVLSNAFFLIVGFYFSRTNHQAIGGIGRKANTEQQYQGR